MPRNFYLTPRIQKMLPQVTDEQKEYTGMKINKHLLIIGGTGAGKTNALYDYLIQTSTPPKGTFTHVFLCYKTDEVLYNAMFEQLGKNISAFKSLSSFPSVDDFPDSEATDYKYKFLVIFDDCIGDKNKEDAKKVQDYFTYGRKKSITICYLSQSFFDIAGFIRKQASYILLLSIKGKTDLNNILRNYGSLKNTKEELYQIFMTATTKESDDDMPFLKICTEVCPDDKKYSRDWLQYITI